MATKLGKYKRSVSIIGVGCTPFMRTTDPANPELQGYRTASAAPSASGIAAASIAVPRFPFAAIGMHPVPTAYTTG